MARNFYSLKGEEIPLQKAGLVAYNDWMRDYCAAASKRLVGLGLLSALDVDWSLEEMKRCAKLGLKGVVLPSQLPDGISYADPGFDPLWTAAQDMDFPLHFHINIIQGRDRMAARLKVITQLQQGRNAVRRGDTRAFESPHRSGLRRSARTFSATALRPRGVRRFAGCTRSSVKWTVRCKGPVLNRLTHPPFPRYPASVFDDRFILLFKKIESGSWERTYST